MKFNFIVPSYLAIGFLSLVTVDQAQADEEYFPIELCAGFFQLGFDVFNYDRYGEFFNDESFSVLAQAGTYTGRNNIEEYVRFATESSPYIETADEFEYFELDFIPGVSFDPVEGICVFSAFSLVKFTMNAESSTGDVITTGILQSVTYSIPENIVKSFRAYYTPEFIEAFFSSIAVTRSFEFICDTLTSPACLAILPGDSSTSKEECVQRLSELPLTEGEFSRLDSNTQGCRLLHSVFAIRDPGHCAHLSLDPAEDPNGQIKCQVSSNTPITNYFTPEELDVYEQACANSPAVDEGCVRVIPNPNPEIPDPIPEIPDPIPEIPDPIPEIPEPIPEIPEPNSEKNKKAKKNKSSKKAKRV